MMFQQPAVVRAEKLGVDAPTTAEEKDSALVFRNADLRDVLSLIAEEYDLNIVMSDEIGGTVSLRLKGASLENTLDAILISRGFDYEIRDNVIRVAPSLVIDAERLKRQTKQEIEPLVSEVLLLRYLDANDIKPTVESMLTSRGEVTVLEQRGHKGFQFGGQSSGSTSSSSSSGYSSSGSSGSSGGSSGSTGGLIRSRQGDEKPRSSTLLIVDVRSQIDRIKGVIDQVDIAPRQILIDARILEVDIKSLEDMGIDFNNITSQQGDASTTLTTDINSGDSDSDIDSSVFGTVFPTSTDSGIHAVFRRLNSDDFNVVLHALLQDQRTKTLSSPKILTVENQEAAILVGEQFPIFESTTSDQGTVSESLSYFQPVGISLQVVCQVTANNEINMIIHPTVSSIGSMVVGSSGLQQPRINIREADTRVLIKSNETLVIGGLLEDIQDEKTSDLPIIERIPLLNKLFSRKQTDVDQRNLLIFITPRIVGGDAALDEIEKVTFSGLMEPDNYGSLYERKRTVSRIYRAAKKNYRKKNTDLARRQFLKILSIDSDHSGAIRYLKKMDALPGRPNIR